jgi:hypothetical protein
LKRENNKLDEENFHIHYHKGKQKYTMY